MKPSSFEYHLPASLDEALVMLRDAGPEAKPLAGGQSLVPMMNFRISAPKHLIDLNRIASLAYIREEGGTLCIGAMTRHRHVERSALIRQACPLLSGVMRHVAHVQIRNRGTIGGSLSCADPAAELPAVVTALDATLVIRSTRGTRTLAPADFFTAALTTALEPDELLVEIRIPPLPPGIGWEFDELSRRRGDFALVGAAALIGLDAERRISHARVVFAGIGDGPIRADDAESFLHGQEPSAALFAEAGRAAAAPLEPQSDLHASGEYRRAVAAVMAERVLVAAAARAQVPPA